MTRSTSDRTFRKALQYHMLNAEPSAGDFEPFQSRRGSMARFVLTALILFLLAVAMMHLLGV